MLALMTSPQVDDSLNVSPMFTSELTCGEIQAKFS